MADDTLSVDVLRGDPENPRDITPDSLAGLAVSMERFGDLSGITWNEQLGILVTGHQRMRNLRAAGASDWTRTSDAEGVIEHPQTGERFRIRIVRWDEDDTRLANLIANSPEIAGAYTAAASRQVQELARKTAHADYELLRLGELQERLAKELEKATKSRKGDEGSLDQSGQAAAGYAIVIECQNEEQQVELLERFMAEGLQCRALI